MKGLPERAMDQCADAGPDSPRSPHNPVIGLLRQHEFGGLAGYDGCRCGSCEVHHVGIDVSCRKSSGGMMFPRFHGTLVRVHSRSSDAYLQDLVDVGRWMLRHMIEIEETTPIMVRFCSFEQDHEQKCVYCGNPRAELFDYLCAECMKREVFGQRVADLYAFPTLLHDPDGEYRDVAREHSSPRQVPQPIREEQ